MGMGGSVCGCTGSPDAWAQVEKWKRKNKNKIMGPQPEVALELVHQYCVENSNALAEAVTGWEYKGRQDNCAHVYHIRIGTVDYKSAKYPHFSWTTRMQRAACRLGTPAVSGTTCERTSFPHRLSLARSAWPWTR